MAVTQFSSKDHLVWVPAVVPAVLALIHRGEAMGLVEAPEDPADIPACLDRLLDRLWAAHVGRHDVAALRALLRDADPVTAPETETRAALERLGRALRENPIPNREWPALLDVFGADALAGLLEISASSVQRYAKQERDTPEDVVSKLHWLALVVGYLRGSYNAFGIRRWFERSRRALGGESPKARLAGSSPWHTDGDAARTVEELARASTAMAAT